MWNVCIDEEAIKAENGQGHRADDHRIQFLSGSTYTCTSATTDTIHTYSTLLLCYITHA